MVHLLKIGGFNVSAFNNKRMLLVTIFEIPAQLSIAKIYKSRECVLELLAYCKYDMYVSF